MTRRLQLLLDEDRYERLAELSQARGASVAALIREAIDVAFPDEEMSRKEAFRILLEAPEMPVDDWPVMKREINEMYERFET